MRKKLKNITNKSSLFKNVKNERYFKRPTFWEVLITFFHFTTLKKVPFIIFLIVTVLGSLAASLYPYFYKVFIESFQIRNFNLLFTLIAIYMAVRIAAWIFDMVSRQLGDYVVIDGAAKARTKIFKHVQDLDFAFHTTKSTGSLISAFKRGDGALLDIFNAIYYRILDVLVGLTVMGYFFLKISPVIALVTVLSFGISLFLMKYLIKVNIDARKDFNDQDDNLSGVVADNLVNFETVKLFAKEDWEDKRLKDNLVNWSKALWRYSITFRYVDFVMGVIINTCIFLTLYFFIKYSVIHPEFTAGDFILIAGFVNNFYPRLYELIWGLRLMAKHYTDIEKYFGLLNYEIEVKDPMNPIKKTVANGEIEFENISFSYGGGKKAIKNLNLHVRQGQSIALVGRSGSGKTTLVKLLMRFYDVKQGKITIDKIDIKDMSKSQVRSFMGVVPQEPILFNNTIAYNIGYGKEKATIDEIVASAKMANLHQFIQSLPEKYNTNVGERGIKLSGGQKQRLAIARMILSDPDIIIFDEATSQLDSENEKLIQDAFWKVSQYKTTIIIAHRLATASRADKIIVMDKGRILESGSHLELLSNRKSLYSYFWNLQIGQNN